MSANAPGLGRELKRGRSIAVLLLMGRSGMLSSVAAAVSLMIASLIALLVISSVVAFNGWPGASSVRDSKGAVSIARVEGKPAPSRQRVVLGGGSSRPAGHRGARTADRPKKPARRRSVKVTRVRGNSVAARRPTTTEQSTDDVLGGSAPSPAKPAAPAAPAPTATRQTPPDPVAALVQEAAQGTDALLGATGSDATPVTDLVDALRPKNP